MKLPNFIIGGTEKAGTTSVFGYLSMHPQVAVSRKKETDFFRQQRRNPDDYARHFAGAGDQPVLLEASPAYLGEAETVAPRMLALLPDVKLLFILRDPIDRFVSSYHFHHGRLNLPADLSFPDYLRRCLAYTEDPDFCPRASASIDEWHLQMLAFGRYEQYLRQYFDLFPRERIRVAFFDDLRDDTAAFMRDLSAFLDIDPRFWATASFKRRNVTFSGRREWLHRVALGINSRLEPLFQRRPGVKDSLLRLYQRANGATPVERTLSPDDRSLLESFYAPANRDLETLLGVKLPSDWARTSPQSMWPSDVGDNRLVEVGR